MSREAFRSDYVKERPNLFSRQRPVIIIKQDSKQENKKIPDGGFIMNIGILLVAVIGGAVGIAATLYLTVSFPAVLIWKVYRKVAKGIPLTE